MSIHLEGEELAKSPSLSHFFAYVSSPLGNPSTENPGLQVHVATSLRNISGSDEVEFVVDFGMPHVTGLQDSIPIKAPFLPQLTEKLLELAGRWSIVYPPSQTTSN
jgi:hypothetical protein